VRSSGDVVRKKTEKMEINARNLIDMDVAVSRADIRFKFGEKTKMTKLKRNIMAMKNFDPQIDCHHLLFIRAISTMGIVEKKMAISTNIFRKITLSAVKSTM